MAAEGELLLPFALIYKQMPVRCLIKHYLSFAREFDSLLGTFMSLQFHTAERIILG